MPEELWATLSYIATKGPIAINTGIFGTLHFVYKQYTEEAMPTETGKSNRWGFIRVPAGCPASTYEIQRATADHISKFSMDMAEDIKDKDGEPGTYTFKFNTTPTGDPRKDIDTDKFHAVAHYPLQGHQVTVWLKAWVDSTFPMLCKRCYKLTWEGKCPDGCEATAAKAGGPKSGGKRSSAAEKKHDRQAAMKRLKDKAKGAGSSHASLH